MSCQDTFVENLKYYTSLKKWNGHKLSQYTSIPYTTIFSYFQGKTFPPVERIEEIAEALGVPVAKLFIDRNDIDVENILDEDMVALLRYSKEHPSLLNVLKLEETDLDMLDKVTHESLTIINVLEKRPALREAILTEDNLGFVESIMSLYKNERVNIYISPK